MSGASKDQRLRARETALQILYHWDIAHTDIQEAADTFFVHQWVGTEPASEEIREFATALARDTVQRLDRIDPLIAETAERWRPERMAVLDRLILRMAVCELVRGSGTPAAVVINEALELARTFSTEDAVKFINGMLDGVRKKLDDRS
jgi:N utilization substance protein B